MHRNQKAKVVKELFINIKKYEKFDFENLSIDGDASSPGDLSISPRFRKRFRNKLPQRLNFNPEMKKCYSGNKVGNSGD
jgi:hypothetical protein